MGPGAGFGGGDDISTVILHTHTWASRLPACGREGRNWASGGAYIFASGGGDNFGLRKGGIDI